ncbi:MAG: hypothetical protein DRQ13_00515 [Ignavibacteriae bacterium]|nr:MAG: hypothetical protein DRQ13_00515 [Ignavibacteriota bacterium]
MNSRIIKILLVFLFGTALMIGSAFAEGDGGNKQNRLNKPNGAPIRAFMNINNISTVIKNTGISDIDVGESNSGLIFPKGSGKAAIFISGLIWGAKIEGDPQVRVGGSTYAEGLQGGAILSDGTVEDADAPHVRIYRVRPTVFPGGPNVDVSVEANDEGLSESAVRAQYETDWTEWPAEFGAPYYDGNGNGMYDAVPDPDPELRDIPGVFGADQTIWYVANDTESGLTFDLYGTAPMGIEMQATFWAYAQTGALGNMFFRKYILTNKTDVWTGGTPSGPQTFKDMYVSMWSDPDVGNSTDDFAGSDTVLSLSFAYNALANDPTYNPLPPPAAGFDFFQGPLLDGVAGEDRNKNGVDDADDFAIFNGEVVGPGKINLPMTSSYYFARGDPSVTDPTLQSSAGADQFYNFFQGKIGLTGDFFVDPNTGLETTFTLSGDAQTGTGWVDGQLIGPGDRRIGMAAGPFDMAPGEVQEVVIAEIIAGAIPGVDRLSAIGLLKFYDQIAQVAYDNFFDLPVPPPAPSIDAVELDRQILLDWSKDNTKVLLTENFSEKGYTFQGYNVYQLPTAASSVGEGVRLATFDVIDGVGKISDFIFDPTTGSVVNVPVQFGNDTGIKRSFVITTDRISGGTPLINGIKYYFAVTAYNYNPALGAIPNNLENPIRIITVIPNSNDPGVTLGEGNGDELDITHTNGLADGGPTVTVVDPTATTGHTYEVSFINQAQVRNEAGFWVPAGTTTILGPDTLTGTTITAAAVFGGTPGTTELAFHLNVVHHYYGWVDGVILTFPGNVAIISSPSFEAGGGTIDPVIIGQEIHYGVTDNSATGNGIFHDGGEDWSVIVSDLSTDLPVTIDWIAFDDGYAGGGPPLPGTATVNGIGEATRNADLWNVTDKNTGQFVLQEESVVDGTILYPPTDFFNTDVGIDAAPIVDGVQINLSIGYAAPLTFADELLTLNGEPLRARLTDPPWGIDDYTVFGVIPALAANSSLGIGTTDPTLLVQDYEFRYTGVSEIQNINGVNTEVTVSGGQMATLYGARGYDIADHPLNPTPGSDEPFAIRVPFEVWSIDQDKQINFMIYDRVGNPAVDDPFRAWNTGGRMYTAFVLSDYQEAAIPLTDPSLPQFATWNMVWWANEWVIDDVLQVFYSNNVVPGLDTYEFTTTEGTFSTDLARSQVGDINVFPNPYYGINSEELNKYNRFVTFTHLPDNAKVRIFNLAGVLVRTIEKDEEGQFLRWDLANNAGLPVASGLYIAYIELPDLGETKILKVAIIQEQQILDRF